MRVTLTIAGSDSGGGAGIQADIKAMQAQGVFAASVLTAITAQNTQAVTAAYELPTDLIAAQIDAVFDDLTVLATKTGMLSSSAIIETVAQKVESLGITPLVVDPVMISKSGFALLKPEAVDTLKTRLLPLATLATPNLHEAAHLVGREIRTRAEATEAAREIQAMGPQAVLVKGGHLEDDALATDVLFDGEQVHTFSAPRLDTRHTHGTGCTLASAIAANLAKGYAMEAACARAKKYLTEAIRHGLDIGHGHGPTHHFYFLQDLNRFPVDDRAAPPGS
ncbi:MAG: bifunctional hydroxymethylpyrimidine kinase/phosphomethylpyrimidine kinase [Bacteroidota bacterium]